MKNWNFLKNVLRGWKIKKILESCTKGGLESESARINIPFYYPKLLHPVHDIDKIII